MGRPFGVPVYVAPSWFLVAALITWVFGGQLDRVLPELGAVRYLVSLFFAVAFYASVLVHELAHTVAALRFKLPVRRIQLQFFGGVSEIEKESDTPGREFVLAFVGPLLSLVLAGVFYLGMQAVEPGTVPGVLLAGLMVSNLIVAAFNLLPGLPLDGGRMLRAVVWKISGRPMTGTVAAAWVGRALAVAVLIGLPLLVLRRRHRRPRHPDTAPTRSPTPCSPRSSPPSSGPAPATACGWPGCANACPSCAPAPSPAGPSRSNPHTPLSEALRRANEAGARALVVVDGHGDPIGLVREAAIVGIPEHRRPWVAVSGLAQDLTDGMRVSAELAGEDAAGHPAGRPRPPSTWWSSRPARSTACCPPPTWSGPSSAMARPTSPAPAWQRASDTGRLIPCPNRPVPPADAGPSRSGTRSSSPTPRDATTPSRSRPGRTSTPTRVPSRTTS